MLSAISVPVAAPMSSPAVALSRATMGGHRIADDAVLGVRLRAQAYQTRRPIRQRPSRLAFDRRVDAAAADPAQGGAVGEEEGAVARLGRSRPYAAHDGRHHEG